MAFLGIKFPKIVSAKQWSDIKAQLGTIDDFAVSEVQKIVAAVKKLDVGKMVAADIKVFSDKALTGAQKLEAVVGNAVPLLTKFFADGGAQMALNDVDKIARELTQSLYNDAKLQGSSVLTAILKILGITK